MSCAAWPGDLLAITGAGMGGGRRGRVCSLGNYCARTLAWNNLPSDHDRFLPLLAAFASSSPATWPKGFLTCYPETGLSCAISCISQSAAARHPLNWTEAQRYAQSRTFLQHLF